jgi:small subunit ribosomal protein S16
MAVKIRLTRRGRKKKAMYDVIVADARSPRDGKLIEKLGTYNPVTNPATIDLNEEKALDWLLKGAQPTDTARRILSYKGLMLKKHLQVGVNKGAITQEQADKKFDEWLTGKEEIINKNTDAITRKKADEAKSRLEAEKKVNEAKAEALRQKAAALVPADEVAEEETPVAVVEEEASVAVAEEVEDTAVVAEISPAIEEAEEAAPAVEEVTAEEPQAEEPKAEAPATEETPAAEEPEEEKKEE